ncbi:hypothetical protein CTAYLR_009703 [Chrysophaeum taylorii]|uniref:Cyclic nucleotide-binding domain-containing protein n=1 Tax=Chrysophaeum taylorii TaxID=2483200 RepID=A0AAD7U7T5_9STRA|nr:hypothetical protein CTAYLR_009703 [Chrysophaeum taylorii]
MPFALLAVAAAAVETEKMWTVIVDAGSTGSRLYVYHVGSASVYSGGVSVKRGQKVRPGLAALRAADAVAQMASLFEDGAKLVPENERAATRAIVRCTGGVRDLRDIERTDLLDAIFDGLRHIPFRLDRRDIGVVSGDDEAFYAFAAANFLEKRVDHKLNVVGPTLGALDLGGSSTQITYAMGACDNDNLRASLFAKSYAGFGAHAVRDRVLASLRSAGASTDPCSHAGFRGDDGFDGLGDLDACVAAIRVALVDRVDDCARNVDQNSTASRRRRACAIDQAPVGTPPPNTTFLAMCNFFYAADAIRALGPPHHGGPLPDWPTPDLNHLYDLARSFCAIPWDTVEATMPGRHPYTPTNLLPSRCFDAAYVLVLLRDVYALDDFPRVTFALDANGGADVEWTLGYFLSEVVAAAAAAKS